MIGIRFTYLTRRHHHATTDSVERIRGDTGTGRDAPTEQEGGQEVVFERTDEDDGLDRVVHSEVETAVDDDTGDGGTETTVETGNTVRGERLLVDIDQTFELALAALLGALCVVGETGTGVVERVDEEERGSTGSLAIVSFCAESKRGSTYAAGGQVAGHPPPVSVTLLLEGEHGLVGVAEGKVEGLGWEVADNVGGVTSPEGGQTFGAECAAEAVDDAAVAAVETTSLDHFILQRRLLANAPKLAGIGKPRTWFWMRSFTRSMGAAAVFETAAATPPTVEMSAESCNESRKLIGAQCTQSQPLGRMETYTYSRSRPRSPTENVSIRITQRELQQHNGDRGRQTASHRRLSPTRDARPPPAMAGDGRRSQSSC